MTENSSQTRQPWDRQSDESITAYEYFWKYYINAEDDKSRTYLNAQNSFRADRGKDAVDYLQGNWASWARGVSKTGKKIPGRLTWAKRYKAYRQFIEEQHRKVLHDKILEDATNWAAMQETALEVERDVADKLYQKAESMIRSPIFKRLTRITESGQTQIIIKPANWRLTDVAKLLRLASDMKRRGLLMPPQGAIPEDSWRSTLLQLGLNPDDPVEWLDYLSAESAGHGEDATGEPDD